MIYKNLKCGRGETLYLPMQYKDANGDAVDLTGYTGELVILKNGAPLEVDATVLSDEDGNLSFEVTDEDTTNLPLGKLFYRFQLTWPTGQVKWLVGGELSVFSGDSA